MTITKEMKKIAEHNKQIASIEEKLVELEKFANKILNCSSKEITFATAVHFYDEEGGKKCMAMKKEEQATASGDEDEEGMQFGLQSFLEKMNPHRNCKSLCHMLVPVDELNEKDIMKLVDFIRSILKSKQAKLVLEMKQLAKQI